MRCEVDVTNCLSDIWGNWFGFSEGLGAQGTILLSFKIIKHEVLLYNSLAGLWGWIKFG